MLRLFLLPGQGWSSRGPEFSEAGDVAIAQWHHGEQRLLSLAQKTTSLLPSTYPRHSTVPFAWPSDSHAYSGKARGLCRALWYWERCMRLNRPRESWQQAGMMIASLSKCLCFLLLSASGTFAPPPFTAHPGNWASSFMLFFPFVP